MARVLLVPFLAVLILVDEGWARDVAGALFVVGAATDGLDGYLARRYETTTRTGAWLDPLADKVLVVAPVAALTALGEFPRWAAGLIVAREVGVSLLRVVLGLRGKSLPASRAAKFKTGTQIIAITLYILPLGSWADGVKLAALGVAVALTVVTGLLYGAEARSWMGRTHPVPPAPDRRAG